MKKTSPFWSAVANTEYLFCRGKLKGEGPLLLAVGVPTWPEEWPPDWLEWARGTVWPGGWG